MRRLSANVHESPDCVQKSPASMAAEILATEHEHVMRADLGLRLLSCVTAQLERWSCPNLAAPYWRLYLMEGAGAEVLWRGERLALSAKSAWLIAPDTIFGAALRCPVTQCYVHFTLAPGVVGTPGVHAVLLTEDMRRWHQRAVSARTSEVGGIAWHALVLSALDSLPAGTLSERRMDSRVERVLSHIERDIGAPHTLESLAAVAGMHARALIRLFRKETNDTPMACLRARRIATACELLHHGDQKIDDISTAVGFCDRYHFTKTFRRLRKTTPAAFRALRQASLRKQNS